MPLDAAATTINPAQRKQISDDLQLYSMQQYRRFPLYWEQESASFWPDVRGWYHHPQPSIPFVRWEHMWMGPSMKDAGGYSAQTSDVPGGL